jgi:AraC-like DNA-binding protein
MPTERWVFSSDDMRLGEFRCRPGDPMWDRTNLIGELGPVIAFPRTSVRIRHEGRPEVVSDPTLAVLYHARQPYRRGLVSPDGDRCSFIGFSEEIAAEVAADLDPTSADPRNFKFPFSIAPIDRSEHQLHQQLRSHAAAGDVVDDLFRETLYAMVSRVVKSAYAAAAAPGTRRRATARDHRAAVDAIREQIGRDVTITQSLDQLAATVNMSPFHLSRVFREQTGQSIHGYRTDIRLRASLEAIAAGVGLAEVAASTGFASHAHLTDRFRRAYGVSPQAWRTALGKRSETSRNMEARGRGASVA